MTIEIETVEQLRDHGYSVSVYCGKCRYRGPVLDLNKYINQGRGRMRPIDLGLRHASCRTKLEIQVAPPKGYGK